MVYINQSLDSIQPAQRICVLLDGDNGRLHNLIQCNNKYIPPRSEIPYPADIYVFCNKDGDLSVYSKVCDYFNQFDHNVHLIQSSLPRAPEYADCFLCTYLHTLHFLYKHYKQYAVIHGGDNRYSAMINTARTIHKIPNVTEHTIRNQQTMNDVLNNIFDSDKYAVMNFGSTSTKQRNNNNNALQSPLQSSINHGSKSAPTTPHCAIKSPIPHTNNTTNDNTKKSHFDFSSVESVLTNKLVLDTVTEQNGIDNETHLSNNGSTSTKLHNSNIMRCDKSWCFVSAYAYGVDGKCSFSQQSCKHMIVKQGTPNAAINHIYQYHKDYCARKQIHDVNNDIYIYCEDCQNKIYTVQYYNDTQHYKVHKRFKLAYKKL